MRFLPIAVLATIAAGPAYAQQAEEGPGEAAEPITVSGSAGLTTDYRFRGVSQTDGGLAVQGGITATHTSGVYVGAWGSNLAGWGTFGGANMELDLYAGVEVPVGAGTLDTGLVWYMYPGGADKTDFAELYAKLSGTVGPLALTAGVAYAPQQEALGHVFFTGAAAQAGRSDDPGDKEDNLYLSADAVYALGGTPVSLKAHLGYSDGNPGLGPNATSVAPTGTYFDWSIGADITPRAGLTFSIAYVDTDISRAESAYLQPGFSRGQDGVGALAGSTVLAAVTASF
ncbi:TorF family putative porin [Erythrobacter sp. W302b]|uniref:TorF family putative porin n=1 Tax=Erythrobacter sp. W302b TaxID=3389874 RepID=UPI00396B27F9